MLRNLRLPDGTILRGDGTVLPPGDAHSTDLSWDELDESGRRFWWAAADKAGLGEPPK